MRDLDELVRAADPEALLLAVDGLVSAREWDTLADLARRCRMAIELGRQLWGVALHIDYRLALEAPPAHAAAVLAPGSGRFTLGPLPEVAASTHTFAALAPHLRDPLAVAAVAGERVVRGEDVATGRGMASAAETVDVPLVLQTWEPTYAVATYRDRSATFPRPEVAAPPAPRPLTARPPSALADDEAVAALRSTVEVWTAESTGRVRAVTVEDDAEGAVARLLADAGRPPVAGLAELHGSEALALLQWAGANGGARGRRRGGAAGRFAAWWTAAMLAGLDWPPDPADLGAAVGELAWWRWSTPLPEHGWTLRLAVVDPADGLAWAVEAVDAVSPLHPGTADAPGDDEPAAARETMRPWSSSS